MKQSVKAILLGGAGVCLVTAVALAAGAPTGEKWKITSSMQMAGMSMPGSATELCKEPGDDSVPVKTEKNCEVYDVSRTGNVQKFKVRCTGKDAVEGTGEFTYLGKDHYKGKMEMTMEGQTMTMAYEGQKLGACDGGEMNLKAKDMQAQANQAMAMQEKVQIQQCHDQAALATQPSFIKSMCKDPEDRRVFCAAVQTHDKFRPLAVAEKHATGKDSPMKDAVEVCGFSPAKQQAKLCASAEEMGKLGFIESLCPAEAAEIAKAQCAGRKYTAISDKYRGFCSSYASTSADDEATDDSAVGKAKGLLNKGKKGLGGLFNH